MKLVLVCILLAISCSSFTAGKTEEKSIEDLEFSLKNLDYVMDHYGIKHKDIVIKQFILETGWGTSYSFRKRNNLFGLYDSKIHGYFVFEHWSESVRGYRDAIQYKYKGGDYYTFLEKLPYAMDPSYINKLKQIKYDL
jgi:flagellum-specific peptidoglycan hydrolase FlgJ